MKPSWRGALVVFAVALILRLAVFGVLPQRPHSENALGLYLPSAHSILTGEGFLTSAGTPNYEAGPMYPLFVAATWSIFGENVQATQLVQVFVDALTPVVCYYLAGLVLGTGGALWGGLAVATYPMLIWYSARIVTEPLCTLFLSLGVFLFIKGYRSDKTATLMLSAGFIALSLPTSL